MVQSALVAKNRFLLFRDAPRRPRFVSILTGARRNPEPQNRRKMR